jgi:hypothetical protein
MERHWPNSTQRKAKVLKISLSVQIFVGGTETASVLNSVKPVHVRVGLPKSAAAYDRRPGDGGEFLQTDLETRGKIPLDVILDRSPA